MATDNFCFYLQNRPIQTGQTGGQWYSYTSPFSIPWTVSNQSVRTGAKLRTLIVEIRKYTNFVFVGVHRYVAVMIYRRLQVILIEGDDLAQLTLLS
jgi:hypothetical protein